MRYMLLLYGDEANWAGMTQQDQQEEFGEYVKYGKWLQEQGWMQGGEPLAATTSATTVRARDGQTLTTDGPFAETKEQLGGYYIIDCENLDQAIDAASRCPAAQGGSVEVRPILET